MAQKSRDSRCRGRNKSGEACRAAPTEGGLCYFHANPDKAAELGRIGGRKNRHFDNSSADPFPKLDSAIAVRDAVAKLIADLHSGKLHPRVASGLAPLINLQLRAIETTDLALRVAKLEQVFCEKELDEENSGV